MNGAKPTRVFVVDDSAVARALYRHWLHAFDGIEIVGEARSGSEALTRIPACSPDIVIMDVIMPGMDGLSVTEELMATSACPILIMSELATRDAKLGFRALSAGALELQPKPTAAELAEEGPRRALARKLRLLAGVPVVTRRRRSSEAPGSSSFTKPPPERRTTGHVELVCIGASTGGPPAILQILRALGRAPTCPIVIVQHMSEGFIEGMARWLTEETRIPIRVAKDGEQLLEGTILLAPDDRHMRVRGSRVVLGDATPRAGYCPSVDLLFESAAETSYASSMLGVLLTGMGSDGARGLLALRQAGASTIAQDHQTSVVYGMPRAALELGAAGEVLSIERIATRVARAALSRDARQQSG